MHHGLPVDWRKAKGERGMLDYSNHQFCRKTTRHSDEKVQVKVACEYASDVGQEGQHGTRQETTAHLNTDIRLFYLIAT